MANIYSRTNRIKFTDIPEKYAIPRQYKSKQGEVHSSVVSYVYEHYRNTNKYRQKVVDALNRLTYCIMQNEPPPFDWVATDPIETMPDIDLEIVQEALNSFYLTPEAVEWDVPIATDEIMTEGYTSTDSVKASSDVSSELYVAKEPEKIEEPEAPIKVVNHLLHDTKEQHKPNIKKLTVPTPKEDLYIQPPRCPRFDVNKIWASQEVGGDKLVIYTTLPEIPTKQNEISVTTNLDIMTESELMNLYPNQIIHTRSPQLYEHYEGIDYDEDLGCIVPIEGYSKEELIDNIIRYPHLFKLRKVTKDGKLQPFFKTIEIDGELKPIGDVWDSLPESKVIPRDSEFVKEYVIRRYLLERDAGVKHNFNIFGTLDPFLTLFMPAEKYKERGYTNTFTIVKQCVTSRIHYKQSRSPILRRFEKVK